MKQAIPALMLAVFLTPLGARAQAAKPAQACTLKPLSMVEMRTEPDGRVSIPATVNDVKVNLLVDTGGIISTLSPTLADKVNPHRKLSANAVYGVAGSTLQEFIDASTFTIGRMRGTHYKFAVDTRGGIEGTLSPDALGAFDVDMDFAKGQIIFFSPDHCPGKVVYWTQDEPAVVPLSYDLGESGHIRIPVTVDGHKMRALIDTGATTSVMNMRAAGRFLDLNEKSPGMKKEATLSTTGKYSDYSYPFKEMNLGAVTVKNPRIRVVSNNYMEDLGDADMILGIGILRQLHAYFAYKERNLYVTPALAH